MNVSTKARQKVSTGHNRAAREGWLRLFWSRHAREILIVALAAFTIHDVFGAHGFLAMWRTHRQLRQLDEQVTRLAQQNKQLAEEVNSLRTDPKEIERIAREQMGLARPGEMIFKLPPSSDDFAKPNSQR